MFVSEVDLLDLSSALLSSVVPHLRRRARSTWPHGQFLYSLLFVFGFVFVFEGLCLIPCGGPGPVDRSGWDATSPPASCFDPKLLHKLRHVCTLNADSWGELSGYISTKPCCKHLPYNVCFKLWGLWRGLGREGWRSGAALLGLSFPLWRSFTSGQSFPTRSSRHPL